MKKQQSGFTLVELVTTVTIVGVLAAVAVPRFANMNADARAGVVKNLASAMKQTNETIYSKSATINQTSLSSGSISFPTVTGATQTITTKFGYAADATELYKGMVQNPDIVVGNDSSLVGTNLTELQKYNSDLLDTTAIAPNSALQHGKVQTPASCEVGYTRAENANTAPRYIVVILNCS